MESFSSILIFVVKVVASIILGGISVWCLYVYDNYCVKPRRLKSRLQKQGIKGPSPSSFVLGNIPEIRKIQLQYSSSSAPPSDNTNHLRHDWPSSLFPHFTQWITEYGSTFSYSNGSIHFLFTTDMEMVKEANLFTSVSLGKPSYLSKAHGPLLGESIMSTSGSTWAHQRKIIAPVFYADRVKSMVGLMVDSTHSMLRSWESRIGSVGDGDGNIDTDINVYPDLKSLSADIISRACFGSNYTTGEEIFVRLTNLRNAMSKGLAYTGIPGFRFLPTKNNRAIWKLEEEINSMILEVVKQRAAASREKDLLQMILDGAKDAIGQRDHKDLKSNISLDKFIVDNCKAMYFAGHETTAITATWCLMLLAAHPDWQDRARAEVVHICKNHEFPEASMLRDMKILTMVIQETLRLYPPAMFVIRTALEDIKFKDIIIPKGMNIQIPIGIIHQDPALWGPDSHKFNPEKFANGILGATSTPQAYFPFGLGARTCAGQQFAMAELKVILCMVLLKFSFSLSPEYHHSPAFRLVVEPGHGVNLLFRRASP